jgi:hypothetical protein
MSVKITITVEEDSPIGLDNDVTSISMTGDGGIEFYERAIRSILHAMQFHPETIEEMFDREVDWACGCGRNYGGTCCDDDEPVALGTQPMGIEEHVHPDKVVETLHGDDIAART